MLVAMLAMASVLGTTAGPQSALFAELFPAHVRYSGASLGYQVGAILGGGIAPFMATWLFDEFGTSMAIIAYFVVIARSASPAPRSCCCGRTRPRPDTGAARGRAAGPADRGGALT